MVNPYNILKYKFIIKVFTLLCIFWFSKSWGQATIPVNRTAWGGAEPIGWTNSGCSQRTSNFACSGNNGTIFDDNGDSRTVFFSSAPDQLIFNLKKSSMSGASSLLVQESPDGSTWTNIGIFGTASGATAIVDCGNITLALNCLSRYVKWTYTKATGNCDMDDVSISSYTGVCSGACIAPTTTIAPTTQTICAGDVTTISVNSSATSPSYTWQSSSTSGGTYTNVTNGTPTGASYAGANTAILTITAGSTYYYRCLVAENGTCTATSATSTLVVNTLPTVTMQPISTTTTTSGVASYTASTSGTGLFYQWQENSGSGFSNISNGGSNPTYAGATNSVLTISNPPLAMSGYSYQCIISNGCGTVTTNGTSTLTVTNVLTCPYLTGGLINGCNGPCGGEGNNEILFMNSGSYSIPVNATNIKITFDGTNFTSSFSPQPSVISNLNTLAGCGSLFIDASSGTIPPNSSVAIMNNGSCFNFDFSSYCSSAPIYVVFSAASTWSASGFFTNSGTPHTFVTNFNSVSATCANRTYTYNANSLPDYSGSSDGGSVIFSNTGSATTYTNIGCTPPPILLPIELVDFYGTQNEDRNDLVWKVASEKKVYQYIIEKSEDGINFMELARLNAKNSEAGLINYVCEDTDPFNDITYYRLSTLETNSMINSYKIIDLDRNNKNWKPLLYQKNSTLTVEFKNSLPKKAQLQLLDLSGQQLFETTIEQLQTKISTHELAEGVYFVKISTPYKVENFKVIIQK